MSFEDRSLNTRNDSEPDIDTEPKIIFSPLMHFRSTDGGFEVLQPENRRLTARDVSEYGFYHVSDKINFSFTQLLGGLVRDLSAPDRVMSPERRRMVEMLSRRKPVFVPLDASQVDQSFADVVKKIQDAELGLILFPETGEVMNQFSAVRFGDGRIARFMRGAARKDLKEFVRRLNVISPHTGACEIDDAQAAYAVEFMQGVERPTTISREELNDWLQRTKSSGLIFGFDVSVKDNSLDNFIRKEGKLYWVDGNILRAHIAESPEELAEFIAEQRDILERFVKSS